MRRRWGEPKSQHNEQNPIPFGLRYRSTAMARFTEKMPVRPEVSKGSRGTSIAQPERDSVRSQQTQAQVLSKRREASTPTRLSPRPAEHPRIQALRSPARHRLATGLFEFLLAP